jgi:acyl carrier protein
MLDRVREFVIKAVEKRLKLPTSCHIDTFNYVDSGYVDSIAIMRFILEIEVEFNIDISSEEIESAEFRTVGGLTKIIYSRITE